MTSIIVVLPAPFGPMMARISPGSTTSDRLVQRLETVEADRDAVEIEDRVPLARRRLRSRIIAALRVAASARRGSGSARHRASSAACAPVRDARSVPDDALRQEQGHGDEQRAQEEQPDLRQGAGEVGLGVVDQHGAERSRRCRCRARRPRPR